MKFVVLAFLALALSGCLQQTTEGTVTATVSYFNGTNTFTKEVEIEKGTNVLEATEKAFSVEAEDYGFGKFLTSIEGIESGTEYYWALYVEGEYAQKGASDYKLEKDSIIEWKLEKIQQIEVQRTVEEIVLK